MLTLPPEYAALIVAFELFFSNRVWDHVHVLLMGAILAPGKRTVTAALRITGLSEEKHFQNYHRVLNRAAWSSLKLSLVLLDLLLAAFAMSGPIVLGLDATLELSVVVGRK